MAEKNERNRDDFDTSEAVGTGVGAVAGGAVGNKAGESPEDVTNHTTESND